MRISKKPPCCWLFSLYPWSSGLQGTSQTLRKESFTGCNHCSRVLCAEHEDCSCDEACERRHQAANIEFLKAHGIVSLYYFTDPKNLPSIKQTGLLSPSSSKRTREPSTLDSKVELNDYVRLSLSSVLPVLSVKPVQVDPKALFRRGVLFSENASSRDAVFSDCPNCIQFDLLKTGKTLDGKPYRPEILIPSQVLPEFLTFGKC